MEGPASKVPPDCCRLKIKLEVHFPSLIQFGSGRC